MSLPAALQVPSRIVSGQFMLIGVIVLFGAMGWGRQVGLSLLAGGVAGWLPARLFVRTVFSSFLTPESFLIAFMTAEISRLLLSSALFVVAVKCFAVNFTPTLLGFVAAIAAFWISSLLNMDNVGT